MPAWLINSESVSSDFVDGEVVAIHLGTGIYYSLRGTAAVLWQALELPADGASLARLLAEKFAVTAEAAEKDVGAFLARLQAEQLLRETEAGPSARTPSPAGERPAYTPPALERYADLQDLLLLDPIHDVSTQGWPHRPADPQK